MKLTRITIHLFILLLFSSCATQNLFHKSKVMEDPDIFLYANQKDYKLKNDDKISISVWDHDDLSVGSIYGIYNSNEVYGKWLMLDSKGNVTVPKLGEIHLDSLTILEAENKLRGEYAKWIVNPIVEVKVLNKEVTVLGEVKTPGKVLLEKESNNLFDIIGKTGDFEFYADKKNVKVVRLVDKELHAVTSDFTSSSVFMAQKINLMPGDVVYIPTRKGKMWDVRVGSIITPIATILNSAVLFSQFFKL